MKMNRGFLAVMTIASILGQACGPYLPPTIVPASQSPDSPALESLRTALKTYIDQTQSFRKDAAARSDAMPAQTSADGSEEAIRLRRD